MTASTAKAQCRHNCEMHEQGQIAEIQNTCFCFMKEKEASLLKTCGWSGTEVKEETESVLFENWRESERKYLEYLEEVTSDPKGEQEKLLEHILRKNANTVYLQQFGLNGATDVNSFRQLLPVSDYDLISPFLQRIIEGDKAPVLTADPITEFIASSGTTGGVSKLFPITVEDQNLRFIIWRMSRPVLNKRFPGLEKGKCTFFYFVLPGWKTPGGVLRHAAVTSFVLSRNFRQRPFDPSYRLTSPDEVILARDYEESTYCHLLCSLLQREEVLRLGAIYASVLVRVIQNLIDWWPEICEDLAKGMLSESRVQKTSVRAALSPYLRADPELAEFVRQECSKKSWGGIIRRLWPNCRFLDTICTGPMEAYIPVLNHYSDNLRLICQLYASSEGYFGVNLNPTCPPNEIYYTLLPTMAYYEFSPISTEVDGGETILDLSSLQVGQEYELLVTTVSGLCRYRLGDILKVVGFYNATPMFQFVRRMSTMLAADTEKTDEKELLSAVNAAAKLLLDKQHLRLQDFTSTVDPSTAPPHYVFFLELRGEDLTLEGDCSISAEVLEDCCVLAESSLNAVYRRNRAYKRIGSLELRIVKKGTFERLAQFAFARGCPPNQYKPARSLGPKQSAQLEILADGVIQQYTGQSCPPLPLSYANASHITS